MLTKPTGQFPRAWIPLKPQLEVEAQLEIQHDGVNFGMGVN